MGSFSGPPWGLMIIIGLFFWYFLSKFQASRPGNYKYCKSCGQQGPAKTSAPGSFGGELALWILLIVIAAITGAWWLLAIGLIYTIYRATSSSKVCSHCNSTEIIPVASPAAIDALQQLAEPDRDCPFCAEKIKTKAIVCKHCGKELPAI